MKTVTLEILNDNVLELLKSLELLKVIRLKENHLVHPQERSQDMVSKYKGTMSKQPTEQIDQQLNDLRNEWD